VKRNESTEWAARESQPGGVESHCRHEGSTIPKYQRESRIVVRKCHPRVAREQEHCRRARIDAHLALCVDADFIEIGATGFERSECSAMDVVKPQSS
jgi:hypothetical protein